MPVPSPHLLPPPDSLLCQSLSLGDSITWFLGLNPNVFDFFFLHILIAEADCADRSRET